MFRLVSWLGVCCALVTASPVGAVAPPVSSYAGTDEMARRIDRHLEAAWDKARITPAVAAEDSEWLRRVTLDLAGRIPTVQETRSFLADRREDRRPRLVEKLLDGPRFVSHFATVWSALLLPEASANIQIRFQAPSFERGIQEWLRSRRGVDSLARDLISVKMAGTGDEGFYGVQDGGLSVFYAGKEYKPEDVAAAVSRVFLGVNIGCAQCHHHPFAEWRREQFWSFAAFFGGLRSNRLMDFAFPEAEQPDAHELTIPGTEKKVKATFLGGKPAKIAPGESSREALADWVVARDNPYFARAIVNRAWAYAFGTGLHEPLDEMAGTHTAASHPEVLDDLAKAFIAKNYDLRWLLRTIVSTRAYALSSKRSHPSQEDPAQFARAGLRGLTAQQLYDSLVTATGYVPRNDATMGFSPVSTSARGQFVAKFSGALDRPTEVQTSILQALTLMNGQVMTGATSVKDSETLAAIVDAPFLSLQGKLDTLFLATLSRKPTSKESTRLSAYVSKSDEKHQAEALADVFWALLNSGEFYLNH